MAQREIKFRGQRTDTKNWVYGYYFKTPLTDENSGTDSSAGWFFLTGETRHCISHEHGVAFTIIPETVGEFTGLKDKNGKEIYEGDILNIKQSNGDIEKGIVTFRNSQFCIKSGNDFFCFVWAGIENVWDKNKDGYEIIGNIYENPELLTAKS